MALPAAVINASDSALELGQSAKTSEDIAECDAHADELASSASITAVWASTPRSMARSVTARRVKEARSSSGPTSSRASTFSELGYGVGHCVGRA